MLKNCSTLMLLLFRLPPGHNSISQWPSTLQRPTVGQRFHRSTRGKQSHFFIPSVTFSHPHIHYCMYVSHVYMHYTYMELGVSVKELAQLLGNLGGLQPPLELSHTSGACCFLLHVRACRSQHVCVKTGKLDKQTRQGRRSKSLGWDDC